MKVNTQNQAAGQVADRHERPAQLQAGRSAAAGQGGAR